MFKHVLIAATLILPLAVLAADEMKPAEKKMTTQQSKMVSCNKEAGEKGFKGDERKTFMRTCLSAAKKSQQDKMTSCNKEAGTKGLKGDERKTFMKGCLSA